MQANDLRSFELFDGVPDETIQPILSSLTERLSGSGERLLAEGHPNNALYLLMQGEVDIFLAHQEQPVQVVHAHEIIGEVSLLDQKPATASAITRGECRVLVVGEELIWKLIQECHPFAINFIKLMTRRFRGVNRQVVSSMERQRVFEQRAEIDALTRLHNRGWLNDNFDRLLNRCKADGQPFSYCMLDIDHFKKINDTYGHPVGDLVLAKTGDVLRAVSRSADHVARYGGEEFAVLLPNTRIAQALLFAERLREGIETNTIEFEPGKTLTITVSIGVATLEGKESSADLIGYADSALYQAKADGRNQVCFRNNIQAV